MALSESDRSSDWVTHHHTVRHGVTASPRQPMFASPHHKTRRLQRKKTTMSLFGALGCSLLTKVQWNFQDFVSRKLDGSSKKSSVDNFLISFFYQSHIPSGHFEYVPLKEWLRLELWNFSSVSPRLSLCHKLPPEYLPPFFSHSLHDLLSLKG